MYATNKVRLEICGSDYIISTTEEPDYVKNLALEIEDMANSIMSRNSSTTLNDAFMICTLSYADQYKKSERNADHIRGQLTEYLEDAARARIELDEAKREIDRLKRDLNNANARRTDRR